MNTNPEKNTNGKALRRPRLNLVPVEDRYGLGGKVIGVANAGPRVRVGISLADCRHHIHVCGPTGTGKTVLLENMIRDDVEAWKESIVTTMIVAGDPQLLRTMAELVL